MTISEGESQSEVLYDRRLPRHEIIDLIKTTCADIHERGGEWTTEDGAYIASLLNRDDDPWGLFRHMDERTGGMDVGYRTSDGREWFYVLRQMRNKVGSGIFENLPKTNG